MDSFENSNKLIKLVMERPMLYDVNSDLYHNKNEKDKQWEEVSDALGFPSKLNF